VPVSQLGGGGGGGESRRLLGVGGFRGLTEGKKKVFSFYLHYY
jgi:hypothetical protein